MLNVHPKEIARRLYNSYFNIVQHNLKYLDSSNCRTKTKLAHSISIDNSIKIAEYYITYANDNKIVYSASNKGYLIEMTEKYYWEQVLNVINTVYKPLNLK